MQQKKNDEERAKLLRLMRGEGFGIFVQIWEYFNKTQLEIFIGYFNLNLLRIKKHRIYADWAVADPHTFYWIEHDKDPFKDFLNHLTSNRYKITRLIGIHHKYEENNDLGFIKINPENSEMNKFINSIEKDLSLFNRTEINDQKVVKSK